MNSILIIASLVVLLYIIKSNMSEGFFPYGRNYNHRGRYRYGEYFPYYSNNYYYPPSPCMESVFGGVSCYPWLDTMPYWNPYYW